MASGVVGRESSLSPSRARSVRIARYAPTLVERRLVLFLADQFALLLAIALSGAGAALRGGELTSALAVLALALVWWVSASAFDCYDIRRVANPAKSLVAVWCALALTSAAVLVLDVLTPVSVSLASAGSFMLISIVLLAVARSAYALVLTRPQARRRALVLGRGPGVVEAVQVLETDAAREYDVVGIVSTSPADEGADLPVLGSHNSLTKLVLLHAADEIVVAATDNDAVVNEAIKAVHSAHPQVTVSDFAVLYEQLRGRVPVRYVCPHWRTLVEGRASTYPSLVVKRVIDVVVSVAALAVLSPVFLVIAVAIKLDSAGPIIYKQQREGLHGRTFTMLKFRSMVVDAEKGEAIWERPSDPRRTRLGKALRRLHLDEGPQLLNVLAGSMSLVGPRPERSQFVTQLEKIAPAYRDRMLVRPGITGWAQVRFGYARSVEESVEKLEHDLYYIKNWSPFLDFVIAFKTIGSLVRRTVNEAPCESSEPGVSAEEAAPSSVFVASS